MKFRREFAMLICAAGCAVALMIPAPRPGLVISEHGTPPGGTDYNVSNTATNDAVMIALRLEASAALDNLQGGTSSVRQ
jgi:hypothetical protein